ncbi:lipocalin family protein [Fibrella forsythiae]|uniref:Lipocalin family protein n=1 Tax=Fibrella forsythiae TaxID=2817061 RepID=A0ABS3JI11_9BACT|nr:lipocalin family protein [Fibrella forsythiae]MBO0948884.1 lipocalin family protein [Fibrella forsythiae]
MKPTSRITTAATLLLVILTITFGCKSSNSDPGPTTLTSLQGSWKITGLTVDPAFVYMGASFTNIRAGLQLLGETCLNDAVITFNTNGTVTNNIATQATCTNATFTKQIVGAFFGQTTTYTESGNQVTLTSNAQTVSGTRVFTTTTATLTAKLATDPIGNPVPTTYVVELTKQ